MTSTWKSIANAIARGIKKNGISKRFEYKGSGFVSKEYKNKLKNK